MNTEARSVWTIGHSTRTFEEFVKLLEVNSIELLVDIRTYPGSRRYPHFNKEHLEKALPAVNIDYIHMIDLGGRRKPSPDSLNTAWRHPAFRGYADYMQTDTFKDSIRKLEDHAKVRRTVYMCSEGPWWKCHRALVSDFLKAHGWTVLHIMEKGKVKEHPYTAPANERQGDLFYDDVRI